MENWIHNILQDPLYQKDFPFQAHFIEVDKAQIHYIDEGTGPVLLLLHGNPTSSFLYRKMIPILKKKFRIIALDFPGFGLSTPSATFDYRPESQSYILENFVQKMNLKEVSLFVQDWAGPIGLGFAGRNPQQIQKLIIGNTWAWPVKGDFHFESFSRIMGSSLNSFFVTHMNSFVKTMLPLGTPKSKMNKEILRIYEAFLPKERRKVSSILPKEIILSSPYLQKVFENLIHLEKKPTLILWGNKVIAFRKKELQQFIQIFKNHHVHILEGAGHYIQEEMPSEICEFIINRWPNEVLVSSKID